MFGIVAASALPRIAVASSLGNTRAWRPWRNTEGTSTENATLEMYLGDTSQICGARALCMNSCNLCQYAAFVQLAGSRGRLLSARGGVGKRMGSGRCEVTWGSNSRLLPTRWEGGHESNKDDPCCRDSVDKCWANSRNKCLSMARPRRSV